MLKKTGLYRTDPKRHVLHFLTLPACQVHIQLPLQGLLHDRIQPGLTAHLYSSEGGVARAQDTSGKTRSNLYPLWLTGSAASFSNRCCLIIWAASPMSLAAHCKLHSIVRSWNATGLLTCRSRATLAANVGILLGMPPWPAAGLPHCRQGDLTAMVCGTWPRFTVWTLPSSSTAHLQ